MNLPAAAVLSPGGTPAAPPAAAAGPVAAPMFPECMPVPLRATPPAAPPPAAPGPVPRPGEGAVERPAAEALMNLLLGTDPASALTGEAALREPGAEAAPLPQDPGALPVVLAMPPLPAPLPLAMDAQPAPAAGGARGHAPPPAPAALLAMAAAGPGPEPAAPPAPGVPLAELAPVLPGRIADPPAPGGRTEPAPAAPLTLAAAGVPPLPAPGSAPPMAVPPADPRWAQDLAERVVWSTRENLDEVDIQLHPPELGPLRLHLKLDGTELAVQVSAPQPAAREAFENNLPRLREQLAQQGLTLVQAQVSDQPRPQERGAPAPGSPGAAETDEAEPLAAHTLRLRRVGLLDEYA